MGIGIFFVRLRGGVVGDEDRTEGDIEVVYSLPPARKDEQKEGLER